MVSLTQLQEVPPRNLILLVGPPGSGKSTFCHQAILRGLAIDKPIIYVTTEYDPSKAEEALREKGLGGIEPGLLSFVDAFNETVGLSVRARSQTKMFTTKIKGPSCFFTTGFLNGFFSVVRNQHAKETRCIAMGDPYCEWEFR